MSPYHALLYRKYIVQIIVIFDLYYSLNSSLTDELENWSDERLNGAPCKYEAQQGGLLGDPVSGNQPYQQPPTSTVTLKELQWKFLP